MASELQNVIRVRLWNALANIVDLKRLAGVGADGDDTAEIDGEIASILLRRFRNSGLTAEEIRSEVERFRSGLGDRTS